MSASGHTSEGSNVQMMPALAIVSILALIAALGVRMVAPSDAWDQDQPKTMGYTTDILVNGNWVLPREQGRIKASKPPLYNWVAAPIVRVVGFSSEIAHKAPSWIALIIAWALLVWVGGNVQTSKRPNVQSTDEHQRKHNSALGWLAGLMALSTYTIFKIGYTARPDMILVLILFSGWILATLLLIRSGSASTYRDDSPTLSESQEAAAADNLLLALGFWLCVGLAALAKGPPALLLIIYAVLASRLMNGTWRSVSIFGMWWGVPLGVGMFALWLYGVWRIDPDHLVQRLWFDEVFGRVTGLSEQGNREGPIEFFYRLFHAPFYFFVRSIPWSILAILAIVHLWERHPETKRARWRALPVESARWLYGAAMWVVIVVIFFSLSTGIRADYLAPAYLPSSLLAAWWLLRAAPALLARITWLAPATAGVLLAVMSVYQFAQLQETVPGFGKSVRSFILNAERELHADPAPLEFWNAGRVQVQTYLGVARSEDHKELLERLRRGETLWVIAGIRRKKPNEFPDWLAEQNLPTPVVVRPVHETVERRRCASWPQQITLYRVEPSMLDVAIGDSRPLD